MFVRPITEAKSTEHFVDQDNDADHRPLTALDIMAYDVRHSAAHDVFKGEAGCRKYFENCCYVEFDGVRGRGADLIVLSNKNPHSSWNKRHPREEPIGSAV
jgi:hypothetical protein